MIEIKQELMDQIRLSSEKDDRYFIHILKRITPEVQGAILSLCNPEINDIDAYTMLLFFMENGVEEFSVKTGMPENYLIEIEQVNPEVHDFVRLCVFTKMDRLTMLVILFRVYESELDVRRLDA